MKVIKLTYVADVFIRMNTRIKLIPNGLSHCYNIIKFKLEVYFRLSLMFFLKSELIKIKIHFQVVSGNINMNQFLQGFREFIITF